MAKIIPFPTRNEFMAKFGAKIPEDLLPCFEDAYQRVTEQLRKMPPLEIKIPQDSVVAAEIFKKEYRAYVLEIMGRTMELELQLCLAKNGR